MKRFFLLLLSLAAVALLVACNSKGTTNKATLFHPVTSNVLATFEDSTESKNFLGRSSATGLQGTVGNTNLWTILDTNGLPLLTLTNMAWRDFKADQISGEADSNSVHSVTMMPGDVVDRATGL